MTHGKVTLTADGIELHSQGAATLDVGGIAIMCNGPGCQQLADPALGSIVREFLPGSEGHHYCSAYCAYEAGVPLVAVLALHYAHQSGLSVFHACPWKFEQTELRGIRPRQTPGPLRRGTLVHYGYQAALLVQLEKGDAVDAGCSAIKSAQDQWMADPVVAPFVSDEWREGAALQVDTCIAIFGRSYQSLGVGTAWETYKLPDGTPAIELPIRIDYPRVPYFRGFQGTIDWIAIDTRTGHPWIVDFKTRKTIQKPGYDERQRQAPAYQHLMKAYHGIPLRGTATYQISAKPATEPHRLKRGGMSRDKRITTTWEVYERALLRAGLDPADYSEMRDHLLAKPMDRMDRYYRSEKMVRAVWDDTCATLDRIGTTKTFTRALDPMTCKGCSIRELCEATQADRDAEFLLAAEYIKGNDQPSAYEFLLVSDSSEVIDD